MKKNSQKILSLIAEHQNFWQDTGAQGLVLWQQNQRRGLAKNRGS